MIREDEVVFDTYKQVKKLMAAGVPEAQAEAQVEIFIQVIDGNLATKASLSKVAADLQRDMKELETNLKRDMKELETRLSKDITIKMGVMAAITISVLATLIKVL